MKKKIIRLTESDLRRIVMRIINEQFDADYYDIILDLYNEVGLEGMTDEEIEYLKSGGESNVPERFLGGEVKECMITRVRSYLRSQILTPWKILKSMDLAGFNLSLAGLELLRHVDVGTGNFI